MNHDEQRRMYLDPVHSVSGLELLIPPGALVINFRDVSGRPIGERGANLLLSNDVDFDERIWKRGGLREGCLVNVSAMRQASKDWKAILSTVEHIANGVSDFFGASHTDLFIADQISAVIQDTPLWLHLHNRPIDDVSSSLFKIGSGLKKAIKDSVAFVSNQECPVDKELDPEEMTDYCEESGVLIFEGRACAAPRAMLAEFFRRLIHPRREAAVPDLEIEWERLYRHANLLSRTVAPRWYLEGRQRWLQTRLVLRLVEAGYEPPVELLSGVPWDPTLAIDQLNAIVAETFETQGRVKEIARRLGTVELDGTSADREKLEMTRPEIVQRLEQTAANPIIDDCATWFIEHWAIVSSTLRQYEQMSAELCDEWGREFPFTWSSRALLSARDIHRSERLLNLFPIVWPDASVDFVEGRQAILQRDDENARLKIVSY